MIGLDIGTGSIKVCQVDKKDGKHAILSAVMTARPSSAEAGQEHALAGRVRALLNDTLFTTALTASSVGGSQILARNFSFPVLSPEELEGAIRLETEQSIFSDLNAMYTDFQMLAPAEKGKTEVLFVAVPKDIVDLTTRVIRSTGLDLRAMDIDNLALTNCFLTFEPNPEEESIVLLNIGHSHTNIAVIDNGELRFIRNVDFGGKDITAEVASYLGVPERMAEEIKKQPLLWGEIGLNIKNVLRKSMPDLLEAVYRSIEYCMSRKRLLSVDKILVTGGTSCLSGIDGFVYEVLGIHTEKWNPLDHLSASLKSKKEMGQFLSVALGLAVRG